MAIGLGSNSQLGIGIAISLNNQFSTQANQVNAQLKTMKANANSLAASSVANYRNSAAAISAGAMTMTYGMVNLINKSSEFQHKINQAYIIGGAALGRTKDQLETYAKDMSSKFANTPIQIANALVENVRAGVGKGIEEITKYQMAAAQASGEALDGEGGVAKMLLGISNAYGFGTQNLEAFKRVTNATTAVANASMSSIRSIGESMEYSAFAAKTFNVPLEKQLALVGKLSQANITGSAAGTALNNMYQYLGTSTSQYASQKQKESWKDLGLDQGQMRALVNSGKIFEVIAAMDKAMTGMGAGDKTSILKNLVNMRGSRAMLGAFGNSDPTKSIGSLYESARAGVANDTAMKQSTDMQNDLYGDMKFLSNALSTLGIEFVKAITPVARVVIPILIKAMQFVGELLKTPLGKFFASIVAVGVPLIGIIFAWRAAVLTATIALRGFAMQAQMGGFRGAFGTSLGLLRNQGMASMPTGTTLNKNGIPIVAAGQTFTHMGKTYKGGQILPKSVLPTGAGMGTGQGLGGALNAMGMASWLGGMGRIGGMLGSVVGFFGKLLPIVGWIFAIYSLVSAIVGMFSDDEADKKDQKQDPDQNYGSSFNERFYGGSINPDFEKYAFSKNGAAHQLNLTVNTNVDGVNVNSKTYNEKMESEFAKQYDSNSLSY